MRNVANDPNDQAMVETINELAHRLGKQTVAEYVESPDCLRFLTEEGIDLVQGFALGRPVRLPR